MIAKKKHKNKNKQINDYLKQTSMLRTNKGKIAGKHSW